MKILILSQLFDPEPTFKGASFAKGLIEQGHEVEILTAFPHYPEGKFYSGYKPSLCKLEIVDGLRVWRTYIYPSHDRSGFRRALTYISFALSARYIGAKKVSPPDVIYIYNLVTLTPASKYLRRKYGSKIVLDVQDPWPESVMNSGMLKLPMVGGFLTNFCKAAYLAMDTLVCSTPGFRENMKERGVSESKLSLIYRWTDQSLTAKAEPLSRSELGLPENFLILFAGTMGTSQDIDTILNAAKICLARKLEITFAFIGGGTEVDRLKARVLEEAIENVRFLPRQPISKIRGVLDLADALLVHLRDIPLFRISIPSKTEAYLSIGKPVLMALPGNAQQLVESANAGICCAAQDPEAIAKAAENFASLPTADLKQLGDNGQRFYDENLAMPIGVKKFSDLFQALVGKGNGIS